MIRGLVIGIAGTLILAAIAGYAIVKFGFIPANADAKPPAIERWVARTSLHAAIDREMPRTPNPVAFSGENLAAGIKLYAANCAVCHGAADGKASKIGAGLYQHPPQLASDGVEDDPEGETFWKIDHGIRFTGMPSFGRALHDRQIWQLTLFLKHMDSLPAPSRRIWKAVPSALQ